MTEPMICSLIGVGCETGLPTGLVDIASYFGMGFFIWLVTGAKVGDGGGTSSYDSDGGGGGCGGD